MTSNRWKYNGKEVQTTGNVNWLDYGAREYDEVIGRWTRPDPMSEKYYAISLYGYCLNSPIKYIDKHGEKIVDTCGHIVYNLKTGWTKYATNNAKRIGTAMLKTHTGKTQWYKMAKSNVKITLDISSKSIETSKSVYRLGLSNSMFVGKKLYSSIITVYDAQFAKHTARHKAPCRFVYNAATAAEMHAPYGRGFWDCNPKN
jgi:RHS repeat-associated protein